jgi:hypothetical protein
MSKTKNMICINWQEVVKNWNTNKSKLQPKDSIITREKSKIAFWNSRKKSLKISKKDEKHPVRVKMATLEIGNF